MVDRYSITIGMATPKGVRSFALAKDPHGTLCKYKEVQQEIESLRHQLAMLSQISVVRERDEWNRRAEILWRHGQPDPIAEMYGSQNFQRDFIETYPEAKDLFNGE